MSNVCRKILQVVLYAVICCLGIVFLAGCGMYQFPGGGYPSGNQGSGSAPTLSNIAISPNPAQAGSVVNVTASYVDLDGDLEYGVAAVSVDRGNLSRIAFRSTYVSGTLTIPVPISHYSRASSVQISLMIRDSAGNWSNAVSTMLSIR